MCSVAAAQRRCWTRLAVLSGTISGFNMCCTRSPKCSYACVCACRARQPWRFSSRFWRSGFASRTSKNHSSRPVRLLPTARRRDAPRRPHRLGPRTRPRSACCKRGAARARKQAHAATPGSTFTSTPKGSRRRPPPPGGARSPAGLGQPSISEATGSQTEARRLPAVPTSVTAAHPEKGPAAADVRAFFWPAYHGLRYRRS